MSRDPKGIPGRGSSHKHATRLGRVRIGPEKPMLVVNGWSGKVLRLG